MNLRVVSTSGVSGVLVSTTTPILSDSKVSQVASVAGWVLVGPAFTVLSGWAFRIPILMRAWPGPATMKPNPAAAFLLTGLALVRRNRSELQLYCVAVALIGTLTLINKAIDRDKLQKERFLKPPRELWSTPVMLRLNALIEKRYESLAAALQQRALSFGRGGMFVRDRSSLPEEVRIGFQFRFTEGDAARMNGSGILLRHRSLPQDNLPAGLGIEFLHLDAEALDPVVHWISNFKPRAFIPKE